MMVAYQFDSPPKYPKAPDSMTAGTESGSAADTRPQLPQTIASSAGGCQYDVSSAWH